MTRGSGIPTVDGSDKRPHRPNPNQEGPPDPPSIILYVHSPGLRILSKAPTTNQSSTGWFLPPIVKELDWPPLGK